MNKCVPNEVVKGFNLSMCRDEFIAACERVEEIRGEISAVRKCHDEKRAVELKCWGVVEELRKASAEKVAEYRRELERERGEVAKLGEAKNARRDLEREYGIWKQAVENARHNYAVSPSGSYRQRLERLESNEPAKPDTIEIPEVRPINKNVEANAIRMLQDLAVAMNDYTLAVVKRRECEQRERELLASLDDAECGMIEKRKAFEKDVNDALMEYNRQKAATAAERQKKINALKAARDRSVAGLKAMGITE